MLRKPRIINAELNHMLASMQHTDILLVTDAGFPIPSDAWVVDLSITRNFPDLVPVLEIVSEVFMAERLIYADYVPAHNPNLYQELERLFRDCTHETVTHEEMMSGVARKAKGIVRTGGYEPWGNIALVAGVDLSEWFDREGSSLPGAYEERAQQLERGTAQDGERNQ